jgi:hypothetical protein
MGKNSDMVGKYPLWKGEMVGKIPTWPEKFRHDRKKDREGT